MGSETTVGQRALGQLQVIGMFAGGGFCFGRLGLAWARGGGEAPGRAAARFAASALARCRHKKRPQEAIRKSRHGHNFKDFLNYIKRVNDVQLMMLGECL